MSIMIETAGKGRIIFSEMSLMTGPVRVCWKYEFRKNEAVSSFSQQRILQLLILLAYNKAKVCLSEGEVESERFF